MSAPSPVRIAPGRSLVRAVLDGPHDPNAPALVVQGKTLTYQELFDHAGRLGRVIARTRAPESANLGAVFSAREQADYTGVLGTLLSGAGYVPLNIAFPAPRNAYMLNASGATTLVVGVGSLEKVSPVLDAAERAITVILPDAEETHLTELTARHPKHRFVGANEINAETPLLTPPAVDEGAVAYLLFTSGTTGTPKGVMVTHTNVLHHLDVMWRRYDIKPVDRFSHAFDLTFDLSVFDMFMPWGRGASVHVIPASEQMAPAKFIKSHELTIWFSVPSVGMMLRGLRLLKPDAFPSLRLALFCGERLTRDVAEAFQAAAPNAIVENLYGPTEATIACTLYQWNKEHSPAACVNGAVPIGVPYDGLSVALVDDKLARTPDGESGELCVRGPQVAAGYLNDPGRTGERFVAMPWDSGPENRWYRTGDIARYDERGDLIHLGRNDDQVKLRGFRVELGEIEAALRDASGTDFAAVVAWPAAAPTHVIGFVARATESLADMNEKLKKRLPDYMVPSEIRQIPDMPLNANGKTDKGALKKMLEQDDGKS